MTDRELMQQALDALESIAWPKGSAVFLTITALRERLAQPEQEQKPTVKQSLTVEQPEQEPVAYERDKDNLSYMFTAPQPRQWQGLTDEDYTELSRNFAVNRYQSKAIEAKLKEKNT